MAGQAIMQVTRFSHGHRLQSGLRERIVLVSAFRTSTFPEGIEDTRRIGPSAIDGAIVFKDLKIVESKGHPLISIVVVSISVDLGAADEAAKDRLLIDDRLELGVDHPRLVLRACPDKIAPRESLPLDDVSIA